MTSCTDKVRPRMPKAGDMWCVYKITAKKGGGAHKVGDKICIYCPRPYNIPRRCAATKTIQVAPGMTYDLVNLSSVCAECPDDSVDTYEVTK